jgi:hypothetical protein
MSVEEFRFDVEMSDIEGLTNDFIAEQVAANEEFIAAVTGNLRQHDLRAAYVAGTFAVEQVEIAKNGATEITFSYDWEAYFGCSDANRYETELATVTGRIIGNELVVKVNHHDVRSTHDEL